MRWRGRLGCLEATYEESKLEEDELGGQAHGGLEATYEESKLVYPLVLPGEPEVWKLPMRNPSEMGPEQVAGRYLVWKLPMRNPSGRISAEQYAQGLWVWKLPMRNPSGSIVSR